VRAIWSRAAIGRIQPVAPQLVHRPKEGSAGRLTRHGGRRRIWWPAPAPLRSRLAGRGLQPFDRHAGAGFSLTPHDFLGALLEGGQSVGGSLCNRALRAVLRAARRPLRAATMLSRTPRPGACCAHRTTSNARCVRPRRRAHREGISVLLPPEPTGSPLARKPSPYHPPLPVTPPRTLRLLRIPRSSKLPPTLPNENGPKRV
jgi:hypothetical protein